MKNWFNNISNKNKKRHTEDNGPKYRMAGKMTRHPELGATHVATCVNVGDTCTDYLKSFSGSINADNTILEPLSCLSGTLSPSGEGKKKNRLAASLLSRLAAFTLAEVLITLGIIGVVAALTIPTLMANYRKQVVETKLKKTYTILSQAYIQSTNDNGIIEIENKGGAGKEYFDTYWKKYLKIIDDCSSRKNRGTYYPEGIEPWFYSSGYRCDTGVYCNSNSRWIATLSDGVLIMLMVQTETSTPEIVNRIYIDINGTKKPNTLGKDIFIFNIENNKLLPNNFSANENDIKQNCKQKGHDCAALIMRNNWQIPKNYPVRL